MEPDGVFKDAPEPMAPTHTTKIIDKKEQEYINEYEEIKPIVTQDNFSLTFLPLHLHFLISCYQ